LFRRKSYGFAATAVLVTLAVVFISLQPRQPPGAEQTENGSFHTQVVSPAKSNSDHLAQSGQLASETYLPSRLFHPPATLSVAAMNTPYRQWLLQAHTLFAGQVVERPELEADFRVALGSALDGHYERTSAVAEFEKAVLTRRKQLGPNDPETIAAEYALANSYLVAGRLADAELLARSVYDQRCSILGDDASDTLDSLNLLGRVQLTMEHHQEAVNSFKQVLIRARKQNLDGQYFHALLYFSRATESLGDTDEAISLLTQTLLQQRQTLGSSHIHTLTTLQKLGEAYLRQKEPLIGEAILEQVLDAWHATLGADHLFTIYAARSLAAAKSVLKKTDEAESLYLEALIGEQMLYGGSIDREMMTLCFYARLLRDTNRCTEAEAIMRYVVQKNNRRFGDGHLHTAVSLRTLASIFRSQQRYQRELLWQARTLIARHRVHGWFATASKDARHEFLTALQQCTRLLWQNGRLGFANMLFDEWNADQSLPAGIPHVEHSQNLDRLVLSWKNASE
ncbi:MAG: tetratricopeptide repeat protein, partial [Planctomycetales bacterium]|nr:tetratricopeptide repeat protein [Planctomycetales bacterium]